MANNESAGLEIVLYDDQEAKKRREYSKKDDDVVAAEPLSWWKPNGAEIQGNGLTRKRKRCDGEVELEEKSFSLMELYKSNDIKEIAENIENGVDPQELLKNLHGWTIEKRKRQVPKNGTYRVDRVYRHPKSTRSLRSLVEVKKFIQENSSCTAGNTSHQNHEAAAGGSKVAEVKNYKGKNIGMQARGQSQSSMPSSYGQSNFYSQVFQRMKENLNGYQKETSNILYKNGSLSSWTQKLTTPYSTMHYNRPHHYLQQGIRMNGHEGLIRSSVGVRPSSPCDFYGNLGVITSDEIRMMVESQVEAKVAEKVLQYERTQREMLEKMKSMERLLVFGGLLPPTRSIL